MHHSRNFRTHFGIFPVHVQHTSRLLYTLTPTRSFQHTQTRTWALQTHSLCFIPVTTLPKELQGSYCKRDNSLFGQETIISLTI